MADAALTAAASVVVIVTLATRLPTVRLRTSHVVWFDAYGSVAST